MKWEYILRNNWAALEALVKEFGTVILLEQYSPRFRYRVPKSNKSVGFFFSFMEILKNRLDVDEYSASQTTLEQIFNGFAREDETAVVQREFTSENLASYNVRNELEFQKKSKKSEQISSVEQDSHRIGPHSGSLLNGHSKNDDLEDINEDEEE